MKLRLKLTVLAATLAATSALAAPLPGGTLNPLSIPKYVEALPIPGVMPSSPANSSSYEIAVRQFQQQVLPPGFPMTTVWGYGAVSDPASFSYPARTIEATANSPVTVKWVNQLVQDPVACAASASFATDPACNYLPHLLSTSIDQTLHWANPAGGPSGRDTPGTSQAAYTGPVPIVVHLHGAHVGQDSDGYPKAWWLPNANNIPAGYATTGSSYTASASNGPGFDVYNYPNTQRATTLWFHDHALGMTRTNVYAGPVGFYLIRGGSDDVVGLPSGKYEIPIAIQDRSFNSDGSLFYPDSRAFFDGFLGPYTGDASLPSDVAPRHNPEFFGNTMVVNGKTWPYLEVERRKYRFRFLNGTDSRFLILKLSNSKMTFTQVGSEGGFLPAPVVLSQLLVGPAERFDVVVDFSKLPVGTSVKLLNVGPDSPFGGNFPASQAADPGTTGQVMEFRVVALTAPDTSVIPKLPAITPLRKPDSTRRVSLNELASDLVCVDGANNYVAGTPPNCPKGSAPAAPISARLGTIDPVTGMGMPMMFKDAITENPATGAVEVWEISNFTADAHPIHLHLVMFQVQNRQPFGGKARPAEVWESGWKDTVVAYPGEITRIKARFDMAGLYLWHCHILSHEDNEMMRPYCVGPLSGCKP